LDHEITLPDDRGRVKLSQFQRQMDYLVAACVHVTFEMTVERFQRIIDTAC